MVLLVLALSIITFISLLCIGNPRFKVDWKFLLLELSTVVPIVVLQFLQSRSFLMKWDMYSVKDANIVIAIQLTIFMLSEILLMPLYTKFNTWKLMKVYGVVNVLVLLFVMYCYHCNVLHAYDIPIEWNGTLVDLSIRVFAIKQIAGVVPIIKEIVNRDGKEVKQCQRRKRKKKRRS